MARTYKRDSRGRFAGGGGGSRSPARKPMQRGTNRLTRDNAGRITSQGGSGATARGGRLRTAAGNKRATVTAKGIGRSPASAINKPRGLKPQDSKKLKKGIAYNRMRATNAKIADRPDIAQQHIPGRFRGQAGKRMEASIDRAVKQVKAAEMARLMKPKGQARQEQSRAKKLRSVHESTVAKSFAKKHGKKVTEVRSAIRGMTAAQQIKLFKMHVKENRAALRRR